MRGLVGWIGNAPSGVPLALHSWMHGKQEAHGPQVILEHSPNLLNRESEV
jgi:hypothetical protein